MKTKHEDDKNIIEDSSVIEFKKIQKNAKKYFILLILLFVCFIGLVAASFYIYSHGNKLADNLIQRDSTIVELEAEKTRLEIELDNVKRRVENIKTLDDLLGRDIKLYIKTHYKKVPLSVAENIAKNVVKFGKQYNISPVLLVGIMQAESGFNPMITGPKTKYGNARGLMQVMPEWVKKLDLKSVYDLYNINTNIESGCRVFNIHLGEAKGSIAEGLYLYVNKDKQYVVNVFTNMGKFAAFRSTVEVGKDDEVKAIPENGNGNGKEIKKETIIDANNTAKPGS